MSEITSKPYQPDPEQCCEACVFGTGEHAWFCPERYRDMWRSIADVFAEEYGAEYP